MRRIPTDVRNNFYSAVAITPNDSTIITETKGIYVGGSGNVAVKMADGTTVTFTAMAAGVFHPLAVTKVLATGTTATSIMAAY